MCFYRGGGGVVRVYTDMLAKRKECDPNHSRRLPCADVSAQPPAAVLTNNKTIPLRKTTLGRTGKSHGRILG